MENWKSPTISELQKRLRFTLLYSEAFKANPLPHKNFSHALTHIGKALGRLFGIADDLDHDPSPLLGEESASRRFVLRKMRDDFSKFLADVVICAIRAAAEFPGGAIDLEGEIIRRATEKGMFDEEEG